MWQINVKNSETEKLHQVRSQYQTSSQVEHEHFMPTTYIGENNSMIYKYLDSNLFAVSTFDSEQAKLSIFIVNGVSGKIVYKFSESNVSEGEAIDMHLSENKFVLAFKRISRFAGALPQQELIVTEFYSSKEEQDTMKLLKDFYMAGDERLTQSEFSSYNMESPIIIQESYSLTVDVKKMVMTNSVAHVTQPSLVVITSNDQVYTIESMMFTARRQTKAEADALAERDLIIATTIGPLPARNETDTILELKDKNLPPYDGVIPQKNTKYISYDLNLIDLRKLYTFSTSLESTSAVIAFGHDFFYARINPEGSFDRLHENFRGEYILAVISGLIVLIHIAQSYIKNKEQRETWLKK